VVRKATPARTRTRPRPDATRDARETNRAVDHNALLRAFLPDGIPPHQDLIAAVKEWLVQADRLARQR
jgi:hypothetical protein